MAGSPAWLLLLALGLCCLGIQGQKHKMTVKFRDSSITHPRLGQRLELVCLTTDDDSGVFWVRLDKDGTLHFIVFISSLLRTTFAGNKGTSERFEATKTGRFYHLVVKSFMPQDEGNYFCLMNSNQMLYFSPGQPAFFPETIKEEELNVFCDIFIWVPLAGACLLLIIALAVTIMLCQRKAYPGTPCRYSSSPRTAALSCRGMDLLAIPFT
ncbi:T-cell surface glycoprotein CD8 alpha chain isoform 6-T7 [Spheniscus humboldti]